MVTEDEAGFMSYECKFRKEPIDMKVIHEELWQAENLGIKFYKLGFFPKGGFSEEIDASQYRLITLQDMYAPAGV